MAGRTRSRNGAAAATATPRKRNTKRTYVVCRVDQEAGAVKLTVLDPVREAKSAQLACDAVADSLPPAQRSIELGAFLAGSYRQKAYEAEQVWRTQSRERPPAFERPLEPAAA